ncbi:zinc ribbon domain-containing protein [Streptococcus phocae subsp. salmonis]|uniref:zinc ribbon domain-containing protein n=1 Tax=Streptococcus phocae TaxID=119224 RepID=UPI0005316ECB|nr:hypothetical protein [Streptococcus phocae]KGR73365.1 hypothetical protein NX86_00810 [Streptococcus phocae subsp. salmonis]
MLAIKSMKRLKTLGALVMGCFTLLLLFGAVHYSKSSRINAYLHAQSSTTGSVFENIKPYLVWADNKEQLTNDDAKYSNFARLEQSEKEEKKQQLKTATAKDDVYVTSVGRKFLIFPDYRIAVKPISLSIKTNVPNVDVLLNQKKVALSDSEDFSVTLKKLPAATYKASIQGRYKGRKIAVSKVYEGGSNLIDLSVSFKQFSVTSNIKDAELYIDAERVGTLKEGQLELADYPVTATSKAYVKKRFPDGVLKSRKHSLASVADGEAVDITISHLLSEKQAGQILVSAFDQLIAYLNGGQDPTDLATIFDKGADNDFYKGLKESIQAKYQTDSRKASHVTIPSILLTQMTQIGKKTYLLDFTATYDFFYDQTTDPAKSTSGHIIQELAGKVTLKKDGKTYFISQSGPKNLTVVSEANNVKKPSVFPESLLGTWGATRNGMQVTMTLAADGTVTTLLKQAGQPDKSFVSKVLETQEKEAGLFAYVLDPKSNTLALTQGIGIGGVDVKYAFGIKHSGNKANAVLWQASRDAEIDYTKPSLGIEMTKQD